MDRPRPRCRRTSPGAGGGTAARRGQPADDRQRRRRGAPHRHLCALVRGGGEVRPRGRNGVRALHESPVDPGGAPAGRGRTPAERQGADRRAASRALRRRPGGRRADRSEAARLLPARRRPGSQPGRRRCAQGGGPRQPVSSGRGRAAAGRAAGGFARGPAGQRRSAVREHAAKPVLERGRLAGVAVHRLLESRYRSQRRETP